MKFHHIALCASLFFMAAPLSSPLYAATKASRAAAQEPSGRTVDVFVAGKGNPYKSIRIPVIINAGGTLVAMAEGRYSNADQGQNDLIVSTSKNGKKWTPLVVAAASEGATFNNPCLTYNKETKTIFLFFQRFPKGVRERDNNIPTGWEDEKCVRNFVCVSKNGRKWSKPKDVTQFTKHKDVTITCSGPNPGVLLTRGEHKGRLAIPFNEGPFGRWTLAAAYTDDNGKTWQLGQKSAQGGGVNEVSMVETEKGGLMIISRAWGGGQRKVAYSEDGGETWGPITSHPELPSPNCQNGLTRYSFEDDAKLGNKGRILFSSPSQGNRIDGIIKMSYDDGETWPVEKLIIPGPFGYSSLCAIKPGLAGLLYEVNGSPLGTIRFTTFTIDWLTDGEDSGMADEETDSKGSSSAKD